MPKASCANFLVTSSRLSFTFDAAFDSPAFADTPALQEQIYANTGRPLLQAALAGVSGCLFAYGQTGSGKTFSMLGAPEAPGVIPHFADELFDAQCTADAAIGSSASAVAAASIPEGLRVRAAFLELYNERLVDLLSTTRESLKIFEHGREGITVPGLSEVDVNSRTEFQDLLDVAARARTAGSTRMNKNSSRSHAIVQLRLQRNSGHQPARAAKIFIIDLAGSERPKSGLTRSTPNKDGININVSLSTLGLVISRLADMAQGRGHGRGTCSVPFRDSKLTFLLKDSLSGNARTQVLITLSPVGSSYEESASTLRFAHSVKRLSTRMVADVVKEANATVRDTQALQMEISSLRAELAALRSSAAFSNELRPSGSTCSSIATGDFGLSSRRGDAAAESSQSRVSQAASNTTDAHSFAGTYTAPNGRRVEVTSDGWLRAVDWDGPKAVRLLRTGSLEAREVGGENDHAPSVSSCDSRTAEAAEHTVKISSNPPADRQPSKEVPSGDRGGTGDQSPFEQSSDKGLNVHVADALHALEQECHKSSSLRRVNGAVQSLISELEVPAALDFIQALVSLCADLDEANNLMDQSTAAGLAGCALRMEPTWLAPGPNWETPVHELLRVKVMNPTSSSTQALNVWSLAKFSKQLEVLRGLADVEGIAPELSQDAKSRSGSGSSGNQGDIVGRSPSVLTLMPPLAAFQTEERVIHRGRKPVRSRLPSTEFNEEVSQHMLGEAATPPTPPEGWQVSLCERVAICYPSGLPSKDKIVHRKVPRPVSPDPLDGNAAQEPEMLEWPAKGTKLPGIRRRRSFDVEMDDKSPRSESLISKSPAQSVPRTPRCRQAINESSAAHTLAAARAALAALTARGSACSAHERPLSADPRLDRRSSRARPWRSLTPSTPSGSRRASSSQVSSPRRRTKLGISAGPGDPSVFAGAFDRNSLRLRNGAVFVDALAKWRAANADVELCSNIRRLLPGTCAVYVRKRPMFGPDVRRCDFDVLTVAGPRDGEIESASGCCREIVHHACMFDKSAVVPFICHTRFPFDGVFDANASNEEVYDTVARPLLENAMRGNLSTLFIFGQTGSGKTYTMRAIERFVAEELFAHMSAGQGDKLGGPGISLACFELAGRKALDLLTEPKAEIRLREEEDSCFRPQDCEEVVTTSAEELLFLLNEAYSRRATDETPANSTSSRSHSVSRITIPCWSEAINGLPTRPPGQLLFVDCAGLERARDTLYFRGQTQRESADINSSLFALKDCIRFRQVAINRHGGLPQDGSLKLPSVRAAPLTKVLAQSLTSSSAQLAAIATLSPNATDAEVSIDTLRNIYLLGGQGDRHVTEERQVLD